MNKVLVFIDAGFLSKVSNYFGEGRYLKFKIKNFVNNICNKALVKCEKIFFYTAPPFQSNKPNREELIKKRSYDIFKAAMVREGVNFREGRCQRLKMDGNFIYHQKGVDTLLTMDLMRISRRHSKIKKIFLIASDSDFVPIIKDLQEEGIEVVLYTFFERNRKSPFSTSNELIKSVDKFVKITKEDFFEVEDE